MAKPWTTLDAVETKEGRLELRQRDTDDFLIVIDGRVLMSSRAHRSEIEVASLACERLASPRRARILIGGLGMGYTLRAALDGLPEDAEVHVAELNEVVVRWCRGPLASLTDDALRLEKLNAHHEASKAKMVDNIFKRAWRGVSARVFEAWSRYTVQEVERR